MPVVKYARLINLGNYENERIEFEDEVQPGETTEAAYTRVRAWVYAQVNRDDPLQPARERIERANADAFRAEDRARGVRQRWLDAVAKYDELRSVLSLHGVEIPELPFPLRPNESTPPVLAGGDEDEGEDEDEDEGDEDDAGAFLR